MTMSNLEELFRQEQGASPEVRLESVADEDSILQNFGSVKNEGEPLINSSIKMLCDLHKEPAVFFSAKSDRYVCFKCLVKSEKLLYIDKSFQTQMEDFERIKSLCSDSILSNLKNTSIIKQWKYDIRACLMRIRS
jgi:hypothetical protein